MLDLSLWHMGHSARGLSVLRRRSGLLGTALGGRAGVGGETIRFHFVLGTAQAAPERGVLWAAGQWDEDVNPSFFVLLRQLQIPPRPLGLQTRLADRTGAG